MTSSPSKVVVVDIDEGDNDGDDVLEEWVGGWVWWGGGGGEGEGSSSTCAGVSNAVDNSML